MPKPTNMLRLLVVAGAAAAVSLGASVLGQEGAKPAPTPAPTPAPNAPPTSPAAPAKAPAAPAPAPVKDAAQPANGGAQTQPDATAGAPKAGFVPGAKLPEAIKLEKNQHDWGVISDQKPVDYDFTVTNIAEETIKISIGASCGCTVPMVEKSVLAPGETTKAQARFNPKGRNGTQTKTLTITVQEPAQKYTPQSVVLTSTVKALTTIEPAKVHLPEVDHRNGATSKFTVTGRMDGFAILSVESNNPSVVAKFGEPQATEVDGEKVSKVEVDIEVVKGADIGDVVAQLTVKTNDDRVEPMPVMVSAQIVGTARANPANAFLRVFTPGTAFSTQVRIDSRNGTAFKVRSVEVDSRDDMSLASDVVAGEGGKYHTLTLAGVTPATAGYVQGTVIVETDVDGGETLRIPFSASIRNPSPGRPTGPVPGTLVPNPTKGAPAVPAPVPTPTKP